MVKTSDHKCVKCSKIVLLMYFNYVVILVFVENVMKIKALWIYLNVLFVELSFL